MGRSWSLGLLLVAVACLIDAGRGLGEPCGGNSECRSGVCADPLGTEPGICSIPLGDECEPDDPCGVCVVPGGLRATMCTKECRPANEFWPKEERERDGCPEGWMCVLSGLDPYLLGIGPICVQPCELDVDCRTGWVCRNVFSNGFRCVPDDCGSDAECVAGSQCVDFGSARGCRQSCEADQDCGLQDTCIDGWCDRVVCDEEDNPCAEPLTCIDVYCHP